MASLKQKWEEGKTMRQEHDEMKREKWKKEKRKWEERMSQTWYDFFKNTQGSKKKE